MKIKNMSQVNSDGITRENVIWMIKKMVGVDEDHRSTLLETVKQIPEDKLGEAVIMISKTQKNLFDTQKDGDKQKKKIIASNEEKNEDIDDEIALKNLEDRLNNIN